MPSQMPCNNIHLDFKHFPRSTQMYCSNYSHPNVFHLMFYNGMLQRIVCRHKHNHGIEVIKLVIVFFSLVCCLLSAWDILLKDARFFFFFPHRQWWCMGKHQRTLSRLDSLILFFGRIFCDSPVEEFQNVATQKNISHWRLDNHLKRCYHCVLHRCKCVLHQGVIFGHFYSQGAKRFSHSNGKFHRQKISATCVDFMCFDCHRTTWLMLRN